jgi:type I restriction enzyme S subunit
MLQLCYITTKLIQYVFGYITTELGKIANISVGSKPEEVSKTNTDFEYINAGTSNSGFTSSWNCEGDTVTTPSRGQGGIGYVGYQKKKFWLGPLCYKIQSKRQNVLTKYLYYFLSNSTDKLLVLKKEGGIPAINRADLINLSVVVPSIEEQERIVSILDRFDTICNDLSTGLPAEIEARQKQYEYYRDKLLSFKELPK